MTAYVFPTIIAPDLLPTEMWEGFVTAFDANATLDGDVLSWTMKGTFALPTGTTVNHIEASGSGPTIDDNTLWTSAQIDAHITADTWAEVLANGNTSGATDVVIDAGQSLIVDTNTLVVNAVGYADKVGIGTAAPTNDLDVNGGVTVGSRVLNLGYSGSGSVNPQINFYSSPAAGNIVFDRTNDRFIFSDDMGVPNNTDVYFGSGKECDVYYNGTKLIINTTNTADRELYINTGVAEVELTGGLTVAGTGDFADTVTLGKATFESWGAGISVLQVGGNTALWGTTSESAAGFSYLAQNLYNDGVMKVVSTGLSSAILQDTGIITLEVSNGSDTADTAVGLVPALTISNDASIACNNTFTVGSDLIFSDASSISVDSGIFLLSANDEMRLTAPGGTIHANTANLHIFETGSIDSRYIEIESDTGDTSNIASCATKLTTNGSATSQWVYGMHDAVGKDFVISKDSNTLGTNNVFEIDYATSDISIANDLAVTGTVSGVNVTSGADPGHTHSSYGDVFKVGTPVSSQLAVWTGDGTIEGEAGLTWGGSGLGVENQSSGSHTRLNMSTFDGDGTDGVYINLFAVGDYSAFNQEVLRVNYDTSRSNYRISTAKLGTGTERDLVLEAGLYNEQIVITPSSGIVMAAQVSTHNIYPVTDDTYYLGKNDDDSPFAWKGVILKDTTDGKYYRIEVISGTVTATDLTD